MDRLVIGVPAHNEAATIAPLADALELGCARLGEATRCELVLAHQPGDDDTLDRWQSRAFRFPQRVLRCAPGLIGKGRNVKMLMRRAQQIGAHLLLVDADLGSFPPSNVDLFVRAEPLGPSGLVLPLWCRPKGHGNSTDFLASPLLFALYGARIRQPLAGQMLLSRRLLATVDVDDLPDDYGIDIAITMHALDLGAPVTQVVAPFPDHQGGGNSHQIMADVAAALLRRLAGPRLARRPEVLWPERYWDRLSQPAPSARSLEGLIERLAPPEQAGGRWKQSLAVEPESMRDTWCETLSAAVGQARRGVPVCELVDRLAYPFLIHAEYRRRLDVDLDAAEQYLVELSDRLASTI